MSDELILPDGLPRCFGNRLCQDMLAHYQDTEWGMPVDDDRHLFEMLTLEGAQAGLSWDVMLRKRAGYRAASISISGDSLMAARRSTTSPTLVKCQHLPLSATAYLKI